MMDQHYESVGEGVQFKVFQWMKTLPTILNVP